MGNLLQYCLGQPTTLRLDARRGWEGLSTYEPPYLWIKGGMVGIVVAALFARASATMSGGDGWRLRASWTSSEILWST